MADRSEIHEYPLADRLIDRLIGNWLDTHLQVLAATFGNEPTAEEVVDRARYLHLAGYRTQLTPKIIDQLRRAGLLTEGAGDPP